MQEQNEQKKRKLLGLLEKNDLIWGGICLLFMIVLPVVFICLHADVPKTYHGESHTPYPWQGEGVVVEKVEAQWQHSAKSGSEFMKNTVGYYPCVKITLSEKSTGSGIIYVRVTDADLNTQNKGEYMKLLHYKDGQFETKEFDVRDLTEANGREATVHVQCGMGRNSQDGEDFMHHIADKNQRLWRVYISNKPEGEWEYTDIGYTTIPVPSNLP